MFERTMLGWMRMSYVRWTWLALAIYIASESAPARSARERAPEDRVRIDEVMAGANGDARIQFIELKVGGRSPWGPPASDPDLPEPRAMLTFHDAPGTQTGEFRFPRERLWHPRHWLIGRRSVLIATQAFEDATGLKADFLIPPLIPAMDGMVCFRDSPWRTG